jgi:broad specificity phosphatase PhoE
MNYDCRGLVLVSSPYIRCLETAQAVAQHCSIPTIHVEPGIAEVGSTPSSMGSDEELTTQNYSFSSFLNTSYQPVLTRQELSGREGGDGAAAQRAQRVAPIIAHETFPTAPAILFVGHGASCLGLVSAFGAPQEYIGYCSLTQFQSTTVDGSSGWQLVGELGSVDHLSDPQVSLDSAW